MSSLQLNLLGSFSALLDGQPLENPGIKSQALLIYLAVERDRPHRRESLFTLLWPGMPEKSARHNLNQAVYALRQNIPVFEDQQGNRSSLILGDRLSIQLNPDLDLEVDINKFDDLLESVQAHAHADLASCGSCHTALEGALTLYQGDFLVDFYLEDSNEFEEWAEAVREAYRHQLTSTLATLTDIAIQTGDHDQALTFIDRQLSIDELLERANRLKIEVLVQAGRRVEAMRHYREFTRSLEDQLGTGPSQETTALYERIQSEDLSASPARSQPPNPEPATPRTNLQPQPTPFIGREQELARLDEMLDDPNKRLITIVGPGGMGKTRLALEAAERALKVAQFPNGVFFVNLSAIKDPNNIVNEIVSTLNIGVYAIGGAKDDGGETDLKLQLYNFLEPKNVLLVLDNFEQIIKGGVLLADLLKTAIGLKIIVTSRERLKLHEEQVFPIQGLRFPAKETVQDPYSYTAFQFFNQCAQRIRPDFELIPGDIVYLNRICHLIGGMPLGLEMAATWIEILSLKEIAIELQKSIDFLAADIDNIPERHRSLTAVCDASWKFLTPTEQADFAGLSTFHGGFSRDAATKVTGTSLRSLETLVKKSLLQFVLVEERYRFHPYLHQFAARKLSEKPRDEFNIRDVHGAYFFAALNSYQALYESGKLKLAMQNIEIDLANIRAAWDWAVEHGYLEQIDLGLDGLCLFFWTNARINQGRKICQQLNEYLTNSIRLSSSVTRDNQFLYDRLVARTRAWEGRFLFSLDSCKAKKRYLESQQILNKLENAGFDTRREKAQLNILQIDFSFDMFNKAELKRDIDLLQEGLSLLRNQIPDHWMFLCLDKLSDSYLLIGSYQEAYNWAEQGYSLAKEHHNLNWEARFIFQMGNVARAQGEFDSAIHLYNQALIFEKSHGMYLDIVKILTYIGHLNNYLGKLTESTKHFTQAIALAEENLDTRFTLLPLSSLTIAHWLAGNFEKAENSIRTAIDRTRNQSNTSIIYPHMIHIEFMALTGRYHEASIKIQQSTDWSKNIKIWPFHTNRLSRVQGWISLVEKHNLEAINHLDKSIEVLVEDHEFVPWSQPFLALAYIGLGNYDRARKLLTEALSTTIDTQNYIPMVFSLPITLLVLVKDDPRLAARVYEQVQRDPFMRKAQLYKDLVYNCLPEEITSLQVETVAHSDEHRESLWETAQLVVEKMTSDQDNRLYQLNPFDL